MLKVTVLKPLERLPRHVVIPALVDFEPVHVEELLKDVFCHLRLRIVRFDFREKSVDRAHAEVDELLEKVKLQLRPH